jgi:hypothetical protein
MLDRVRRKSFIAWHKSALRWLSMRNVSIWIVLCRQNVIVRCKAATVWSDRKFVKGSRWM